MTRRAVLASFAASVVAPRAGAIEREPVEAYRARRRALAERRPDGPILLFGLDEADARLGPGPLFQDPNFYYLSGLREPGAALLLEPGPPRETLFLPPANRVAQEWDGPRIDPAGKRSGDETGFERVRPRGDLAAALRQALAGGPRLYTLAGESRRPPGRPAAPDAAAHLREMGVEADVFDIRGELSDMRLRKSAGEIALIEKAVAASVAAHRAAWRALRPGMTEYEVFAAMSGEMIRRGAIRPAYPPIVASGPNAAVLHYAELTRRIRPGELVLMDVGGDYGGYAADLTRTVPAGGRFTKRQRRLYDWTLAAQDAAIAALRPGARLTGPDSLTEIAQRAFNEARPGLAARFRHAAGHFVGLDVHDPSPLTTPLDEGMVVTVEPGLYLPGEGIGIRIEDMFVVGAGGARMLSADLPRAAEEIERTMAG